MKTLSLPIRGQLERLCAASDQLYLLGAHAEGHALGVYRLALAELVKGELRGEEALSALPCPAERPIKWIDCRADELWALDDAGGLWSCGQEDQELKPLAELGRPVAAAALTARGLAWADQEGGVQLWGPQGAGWSWSPPSGAELELSEAEEPLRVSAMCSGPEALIVAYSDGSMRMWGAKEGEPVAGEPLLISAHEAPVSALLMIEAEGRPYLLSYCEELQLKQTRLDDLNPMSRAAQGKGLHTLPVSALIAGPLGRFYSLGRDGALKAWHEAYSNLRPASHDGLGELVAGALFECPVQDMDGLWQHKPSLALARADGLTLYELVTEPPEGDEAQRGRLGPVRYQLDLAAAWLERQRASDDEAERLALIDRVTSWRDGASLKALATIAQHDPTAKLRLRAVQQLLKSEHPQVIHHLERLLSAQDERVALQAFEGLRRAHGQESLYPMRKATERGGVAVAVKAAEAYAERAALRDEEASAALKALLSHEQLEVAQATRVELERYLSPLDATFMALESSRHLQVRVASVQRMYRLKLTGLARVQARLQSLREDSEGALRQAALSATLLSRPSLAQLLRADDELLHEQLRAFEALDLQGEARQEAQSVERPTRPELSELDGADRQALFELSACARPEIAIYGPVALGALGDLRALPILLALSRTEDPQVRLRATRGLSALAQAGERRALTPLKSLCSDEASAVRLAAFEGLKALLSDEVIHYIEIGLSAPHHDLRIAAIAAGQALGLPADDEGAWSTLKLALNYRDDLTLAREARKLYLRDEVGGDALGTHLLLLESCHPELRRATLHDMVAALKAGRGLASGEELSQQPGAGGPIDLSGQSFLFTGTLTRLKRAEAQKKVVALGGLKASAVNAELSYLVLGDAGKAGSKLDKAKKIGVRVLSETEFMEMIGEGVGGVSVGLEGAEAAQAGADEVGTERAEADAEPRDPFEWIRALASALLDDPSEELRAEVRRSLIGESEGKGALVGALRLELLGVAFSSRHRDNRLSAISALEGVEDIERALELLSARLHDSSSMVSSAALKAALKLSDEAAERLLSAGLSHEDVALREAALSAVISAPKRASWRAALLWAALEDASASLRARAMECLGGDESLEVAERLLEAPYADIRGRAAFTLARHGDERALPFVIDALSTPAPTLEQVQAAQEELDGGLGLLDERRWRREVTVALSAHQRALSSDGLELSQSLSTLVSVQDQLESAHQSALHAWRERLTQALKVAHEGELTGAWEAVWALRDHEDLELRQASWRAWSASAPASALVELRAQLTDDERALSAAWALARHGAVEGLLALRGRGASLHDQLRAALLVGDADWWLRVGAEAVTAGGAAGRQALYLELSRLMAQGGEPTLLTAALSSDDQELRRVAAGLIEQAYDHGELRGRWRELMQERRPLAERELEAQLEAYQAGSLKDKPKGRAPKWPSEEDWGSLAELVWHSDARARDRAQALLKELPHDSESARSFLDELKLLKTRYGAGAPRSEAPLELARDEARALAFGAYTGLLSLSQDAQALQELTRLIDVDPAGSLALLTVVLRGSSSLRSAAQKALHEHREALGLSELELAEQLIAAGVDSCVREGAGMIASSNGARAMELILSDIPSAAEVAYEVSLHARPEEAIALSRAALDSAVSALRAAMVARALRLLKAAERFGWSAGSETLKASELAEERGYEYGLEALDLTLIKALAEHEGGERRLGEVVYELLLSVLSPPSGERPAFADVQLLIAEGLATRGDERAFEALHKALFSDDAQRSRRGLRGLSALASPRSAPAIWSRIINDPAQSFDQSEGLSELRALRDPQVVDELLARFGDEAFDDDELSQTVLGISGFDQLIDEDAIWEEMSEEQREEEEKRAYQSDTLAKHLSASVRAGRFYDALYYEDLVEAARTARGPAPSLDAALTALFKLPRGEYEADELRRGAVRAYAWRAAQRGSDPSPLSSLLQHRDDETRWEAALGLASAKRSEGLDLLLQLVKDREHGYSLRARAVKALGLCADLRAVRALLRVHDDPEDYLKEEALEALGYMGASEVADEIRARLIEGLSQPHIATLAISGIRMMKQPETWSALRAAVRHGRLKPGLQVEALRALREDSSEESLALFEWLLRNAQGATRGRSQQVKLEAYRGWRAALGPLLKATQSSRSTLDANQSLAPERCLFVLDVSDEEDWESAVEAIVAFGDAPLWLSLCFEAHELSARHRAMSARFESALRALEPAPLELMLERLSEAAERAPSLAALTLGLMGSRAEALGASERAQLLSVTATLREGWSRSLAETLGAPLQPGSQLAERMSGQAQTWERLLWLWGRAEGGVDELWAALETPGLTAPLAREALLSLGALASRGALRLDERLLSAPGASHPELASLVTGMIGGAEELNERALTRLGDQAERSYGDATSRVSLWGALSSSTRALSQAQGAALSGAALKGDPLALDALVRGEHTELGLSLLGELMTESHEEPLTCALLTGLAQLGSEELERGFVELAQRTQRPHVAQAAWRARRRSARLRGRSAQG